MKAWPAILVPFAIVQACGGKSEIPSTGPITPPEVSCTAGEGTLEVSTPTLTLELRESFHEGWLASPAVADIDGDGANEIIAARAGRLLVWTADGNLLWSATLDGRIWASPIVGDLLPQESGLEIAVASRAEIFLYRSNGELASGYPTEWRNEIRSLAAGDVDGNGSLDLIAATTSRLEANGQRDALAAFNAQTGSMLPGFPPNTTGSSGCSDACFVTGAFDQNLAVGDLNGDGVDDIFMPHDNAYMSVHEGDGSAFPAAQIFEDRDFFPGIRFLHDYALAQQGYADDEDSANQAHFTNSAPAIADVDGDGNSELVVVGSVQNASQNDRRRGVALWVLRPDGTRPTAWESPFHVEPFLGGLNDFEGVNIVATTNQVSIADLDPDRPGLEMLFSGFDGLIHVVDAARSEMWSYSYTGSDRVRTAGIAIADLSDDGRPEIVFATYSPDANKSHLFILGPGGAELHKVPLPDFGSMAVPTLADLDKNGTLEIVIALKGGNDESAQVLVYEVESSGDKCLPWPTGRGNQLRSGVVP